MRIRMSLWKCCRMWCWLSFIVPSLRILFWMLTSTFRTTRIPFLMYEIECCSRRSRSRWQSTLAMILATLIWQRICTKRVDCMIINVSLMNCSTINVTAWFLRSYDWSWQVNRYRILRLLCASFMLFVVLLNRKETTENKIVHSGRKWHWA